MANLITVGRLVALFVVIWLIYVGGPRTAGACMLLIALIIAADGLDGWVARRRGATSQFGAVFDIAGDRIVENACWIVFADLRLVGVWVPLLVMTRGFVVDGLRSLSYTEGMTPFGERNMMRSAITRWLTAGRFMRAAYGYAKAGAFVFLTGLAAARKAGAGETWVGALYDLTVYRWLGWAVVGAAIALTVIRGVPVVIDAWPYLRRPAAATAAPAPTAEPRGGAR